ncbi:hypothetical protein J437_LFUL018740 [Ladona fulva]|uniref:Uncharacterized protein n=1 Tax=Ladona fulva TaxID=123851 RepID=A0A8K0P7P8_LADFU|nr:hypothetical protein J437_LFUL018740 [Ladona fulva]
MTHGENGGWLHAKDFQYKEEEIWRSFEEVPSLTGKPKIFLFQCCRGDKVDYGEPLNVLSCHPPTKMKDPPLPKNADFFVVHSAPIGYESWKSPDGAWLIQDFCTQLEKNAAKKDLAKIMTLVANSMSKRLSNAENEKKSLKKQVPVTTSTLTKLMYFCKQNQ